MHRERTCLRRTQVDVLKDTKIDRPSSGYLALPSSCSLSPAIAEGAAFSSEGSSEPLLLPIDSSH